MLKLDFLLVPLLALVGLLGPGWLGVSLGEDDNERPMVNEVVPDSPAQKAGIKAGDVILAVGATKVASIEELMAAVKALQAGSKVKIKVERDGKPIDVEVVLGERPAELAAPQIRAGGERVEIVEEGKPKTGAAPKVEVQAAGRPFLGVALEEAHGGVQITDVVEGGPAAKAGVEAGQLLSIGDSKIQSLADVDKVMGTLRAGQTVKVTVREDDETETYQVVLGGQGGARVRARDVVQADKGDDAKEAAAKEAAAKEAAAQAKREADAAKRRAEEQEARARREAERQAQRAKAQAERAKAQAEREKAQAARAKAQAEQAAQKADAQVAEQAAEKAVEKEKARQPAIARVMTPGPTGPDPAAMLRELRGKQPLVLVFGAAWDANSKAMRKSFDDEAVRKALGDRKVVWLDTDKNGKVADEYQVQNLPHTVLLDAAGKRVGVIEGYQPAEMLAEKLLAAGREAGKPGENRGEERRGDERRGEERRGEERRGDDDRREGDRDLQGEIRQLREEIRELRAMLRQLMRDRR